MTKILWQIAVVCTLSAAVFSQDPKPLPTPPDDGDVVKISTNLIQIDVAVTDAKGKPVTDLRPDEIEILENGVRQPITSFSFISGKKPAAATPATKDAIPIPNAPLRPEQIRRTIALVVDDLSLSFESAFQTRRSLKKFVDEQMQDGDLVAIIRTGAGIGALQQFTSDKRILYAAIERVKWNAQGSGGISAFAPIEPAVDTSLRDAGDAEADEGDEAIGSGQSLDSFRNSVFATGTLGALRYIVTGMAELPGRKSVIMFSDGFRLFEEDDASSDIVLDFLRQLVDTANRSSVVFYTVDARGLQTTSLTAADQITDTSPEAMESASKGRRDELLDTQEGLSHLAEETGGFVVKNSNDLAAGVRRVLEDQSYYLVGYEPDAETFDPEKRKFNKLEIRVARKGATARYRSGFFNVADRAPEKAAAVLSPVAQLEKALVSPFAVGGIGLRLNALFGNDKKTGSFVRSLLHINAADLKFTDEKDGTKKAVFDILAMSFGDNGDPVDTLAKTYSFSIRPAEYKKIMADGFLYHFSFPVKKAGAYQYRIALRDTLSGRVGSASQFIEVPDLGKKQLTISSIVLENVSNDEWRSGGASPANNPMSDTALRKIKIGTVLRYGFELYNVRLDRALQPNLQTRIRVFRDGNLVLDGKANPVESKGQPDMQRIKVTGALAIGTKLLPGDYILQVIATDTFAGAKRRTATQFVQFEVVQ